MTTRRALLPVLLTGALLVGCSSDPSDPLPKVPVDQPRIDLDPERYLLDYEENRGEGTTAYSMSAPSGGSDANAETGVPAPLPPEPTIHDGNTFVDPGDNGFVKTNEQTTSTFGLDVDTGSFSVGRTFLTEGSLPPPASVRTEEWVNALGSQLEAPTDTALSVTTASARSALGDTHIVRVGVAARELDPDERSSAHLTFVVDTSGSMDIRERLGLVKASLGLLVLNLRDDDTIAIVEYSDSAGLILEPTRVSDAQTIVDAIDDLRPSNSTNLEAGLREGYRQAQAAFDPDGINAVILASDGVANVGLTDPDGLAGVIQDRAEEGIHLVTVGYGMGNYNDDLMEQVADQGDGFYAYLDTYEQAERLFGERLTSTLVVVAGDAKAQVTFDPALVSEHRLIGYENRALNNEDFTDDTVDAGEIGAGHRVTALYEVKLTGELAADEQIGTASVRYEDTESGEVVTVDSPVVPGDADATAASADLRFQAATAAFADWLADRPVAPSGGGVDDGGGDHPSPPPYDHADPMPPITPPAPSGADLDRLEAIRTEAQAAATELGDRGLPGASVTVAEMLDLMDLATRAQPAPGHYGGY